MINLERSRPDLHGDEVGDLGMGVECSSPATKNTSLASTNPSPSVGGLGMTVGT